MYIDNILKILQYCMMQYIANNIVSVPVYCQSFRIEIPWILTMQYIANVSFRALIWYILTAIRDHTLLLLILT